MLEDFALDSSPISVLVWRVHPARERPGTALLTAVVIVLAGWLSAALMDQAGWGIFAAGVLIVGSNRFFFLTRYALDAEGITARFPLKTTCYQWSELRRFVYDGTGGFLSPRARRSFLDEYRGISLLFGEDPEAVIHQIRSRLPGEAIVRDVSRKANLPREEQTPCGG